MKRMLIATTLLLSACGADAPAPAPGLTPTPTVFTAANPWTVTDTTVSFTGTQEGTPFTGTFTGSTIDIDLDPDAPETGRIRATLDLSTANTNDEERDRALPTRDWFSIKAHPTATWESDSITRTPGGYLARGTLTLKGVSRPADLPFTLDIDGDTARARGQLTLSRQDFGVGSGAYDTDQWIAFPVAVDVDITATR